MVSIHIPAMSDLVAAMEDASSQIPQTSDRIRSALSSEGILTINQIHASHAARFVDTEIVGIRRRLAMARFIEAQTPGQQPYAQFDESIISTVSPQVAAERAERAADLLDGLSDGDGEIPGELLDLLEQNMSDPYFAAAFARNVEPADLSHGLLDLTRIYQDGRGMTMSGWTPEDVEAFEDDYTELITGLGTTMGLATQNGGDLALPADTAQGWVDFITSEDQVGEDNVVWFGQGAALTSVMAYGSWDADFLTEVTQGVYFYERSTFGEEEGWLQRATGEGIGMETQYVWTPGLGADGEDTFSYDPLAHLMHGLGNNREAAQHFLAGTVYDSDEEITAGGESQSVSDVVKYLIAERRWPADDAFGAQRAMALAITPQADDDESTRFTAQALAADIKHAALYKQEEIEARADDGGNWFTDVGHLVLDGLGLVPVVGEPADAVNGVWYAAEGDVVNAGLSFAALAPLGGQAFTAGKWTLKGADGTVLARGVDSLAGFSRLDGTALEASEAGFALTARSTYVSPGVFEFSSRRAFNAATRHPHPGVTYRFKGVDWTTDAAGRTVSVSGKPSLGAGGRNAWLQRQIGNEGRDSDVGFHLLADSLGGPTNRLNVVQGNGKPIDDGLANLNQGAYAAMERRVREALKNHDDVQLDIRPVYRAGDPGPRPEAFEVITTINGWPRRYSFDNK